MGQLFFSLSVAMGIMIAYGSYVVDDANLVKSINQIEIFDTVVAFLAGVMIIPAVYTFMGREGMAASGPSLDVCVPAKGFYLNGKNWQYCWVPVLCHGLICGADKCSFRNGGSRVKFYGPVSYVKDKGNGN